MMQQQQPKAGWAGDDADDATYNNNLLLGVIPPIIYIILLLLITKFKGFRWSYWNWRYRGPFSTKILGWGDLDMEISNLGSVRSNSC